ncbi:MAG: tripartite tricarboxylate transporter substrate binding protein, partial [Syntrophales bacterium LBB04]|nr:tripartite tricarboxylate transporter substrate binding protein [Syntrophales bacterium LBB04]
MDRRRSCLALLVCICLVLMVSVMATGARAEYPERPITMMVTYAAGGSMDMSTRAISAAAEKILGKPIIVENKPGGGGTVALALLANAKPDGYTLCGATDSGIIRVPQLQKMTYKPLKDFTPLIAYAQPLNTIVVRKDAPWKSMKELLEYAKKNPNKIKYSSGGVGTGMHHGMAYLELQDGIKWIHVPYKGNADALTALMGGHVDVSSVGPESYPYARAGTVRILAIAESRRNPKFPDIPTLKELGYDFANDAFFSVLGPAGLPPEIAKKLENAFVKATESKEVKVVIDKLDLLPILYVGNEYDDHLKNYWPRMG